MILGVDVSKDKLDVYVLSHNKHYCIGNELRCIRKFFTKDLSEMLAEQPIELVVFEATGGYEKTIQSYLMESQIAYHRAHPNRVHYFGKAKGHYAKTDRIDAQLLAEYGAQTDIQAMEGFDKNQLEMQELSSRRAQLKEMLNMEKLRLNHPFSNKQIKRSIKRQIKLLTAELDMLSKHLNKLITQNEALVERRNLLTSVKGIGDEIATILIAELPELGTVSREAISHLVGVAPQTNDSGKKQGYRSISKGRSTVRKALYMAALVAVRFNPRMTIMYNALLNRGKKKKVALVAVMRKILIMINAMLKNNSAWSADKNLT